MGAYELALDEREKKIEWSTDKCDQYDYMIAAFCGLSAGIIDALFVKAPGQGKVGQLTDKGADALVEKIAKMVWQGDGRSSIDGKPKLAPDNLEKAISYLEQAFPVNYDARYAPDLLNTDGALKTLSSRNHHLLSLAHSPDIIGLLCSILDQFTGAATFVDKGKLIHLFPVKDARNNKVTYMQGTTVESKIFCGICNWLGHLASDLCGSSSTRREGKTGRGMGLPMPFYSLFLFMDFGNFDGKSFADLAVEVFEKGSYDFRHGAAMALPVLLEELSIKVIWVLKRHYSAKKDWKECKPSSEHADLRMMLIVGNASLCLVDGVDAAIRSGGNTVTLILHMNLLAWARLIMLVFKELRIRYGGSVDKVVRKYLAELGFNDRYALEQYYEQMNERDKQLSQMLKDFVKIVEEDYRKFQDGMNKSLNPAVGTSETRRINSVQFARSQGVEEKCILKTTEETRKRLDEGWKR